MRLSFTTLLAFTLPFFSSAAHLSRREHPPSSQVFSSRQHRIPRTILDLCVNLDVDLLADASQLLGLAPLLGPLGLGSNIHLCLCLKDLDIFLDTNVDVKALVGLLGKNTVSALITALINTSPNVSKCSFPQHAHHTCNNNDPCHYKCDPHYVRVGNTCVCAPPYTSCNGDCDIFPKGCGSAVPRSFNVRNGPITTIAQAKATCKPHETVCGIPGRENTLDFECINIHTANDSCGGCMAPQPFVEADPVLRVSGTDCTRIPNAKISQCSAQRCIVSKCKVGWTPNQARDSCILDSHGYPNPRKALKRQDPLATNVTTDLLGKIGTIVDLVSGLNLSPSKIPASSSSSPALIPVLLSGVSNATSTLIASTTVPSLLNNLDTLLNVSSLLSSAIASGTEPGPTDLEGALNNIVAASLDLKNWCANNVLTGLNLSGLLSGLSLNNPTAVVNSNLVDQIKSLVGLVVGLAGVSSHLPPLSPSSGSVPTSPSSINANIINSIIKATADIVNASTVNSLVSGIGALVNVNGLASNLLDSCGCVTALGLGSLVANLAQVVNATLEMRDWCDTYPVASIPQVPATSISNTGELPIDVGLSDLLSLLRPVESGVAVSGLGTTIGALANGFLGGLGSGLLSTGDVSAAGSILNPEFVTQLEGLVNLIAKLVSSLDVSTLSDPNLIADVVQKTSNLLGSPTVISLVANIDALINASSALHTALMTCACADSVVNDLVHVMNIALELKKWYSSNPLVISQSMSPPSLLPGTLLSVSADPAVMGVVDGFNVNVPPLVIVGPNGSGRRATVAVRTI